MRAGKEERTIWGKLPSSYRTPKESQTEDGGDDKGHSVRLQTEVRKALRVTEKRTPG